MNRNAKFDWFYDAEIKAYCIVDLYDGTCFTVTNDAENVITCINQSRCAELGAPLMDFILYQDTDGIIDEIIPTFDGQKCISVFFKHRGYSTFKEHVNED